MKQFSERENKIIKILGKRKKTFKDISEKLFTDENAPLDKIITIANSVRRIIKKCDYHSLPWTIEKTWSENKLVIKRVEVKRK